MPRILSVDLASRFSAAMVRDTDTGEVLWQGDSAKDSGIEWAHRVGAAALGWQTDLILIEDIPYGINSQQQIKSALRMQGMVIYACQSVLDKTRFVNPSTWQAAYPGVKYRVGGTEKERIHAAMLGARELGYVPPDLLTPYLSSLNGKRPLKKITGPIAKTMTDYVDAFLINHWAEKNFDALWTMNQVQPAYV